MDLLGVKLALKFGMARPVGITTNMPSTRKFGVIALPPLFPPVPSSPGLPYRINKKEGVLSVP